MSTESALGASHNLRDLGGARSADGRRVRSGVLFRSGFPSFAIDDPDAAPTLGLRRVVDLRRAAEVTAWTPPWEAQAVEHVRRPLAAGGEQSWKAAYVGYLTHAPERVVDAVAAVIDPASWPVLFHCAAGKDRTGVVSTLVLALLDVPAADLVADHLVTAESLRAVLDRLRVRHHYADMLRDEDEVTQRPRPEQVHELLDWLQVRGGARTWLEAHGLSPSAVDGFRAAAFVGPGSTAGHVDTAAAATT